MTDEDIARQRANGEEGGSPGGWHLLLTGLKIFAALCVLAGAIVVSGYWMMNRPRAGRKEPEEQARLVETREVTPQTHQVTVRAMGTVVPVDKVGLVARVSGQITDVNPDLGPGSHMEEGEVLARVDQSDYRLALEQSKAALQQAKLTCRERKLAIEQRKSEIAQAEKNLKLEKARQDVARGEYDLLVDSGGSKDEQLALAETGLQDMQGMTDTGNPGYLTFGGSVSENEKALILRRPQLKAAKSALQAAKAGKQSAEVAYENALEAQKKARTSLEQAELDFERTTIEVPFEAVVQSEQVGVGTYVSPGNPLATLVNTERYRVELSVPVDQLRWIRSPSRGAERGSKVRIFHRSAWGEGRYREGRVRRLKPGIEEQGRMARVVVEVEDPRCLEQENAGKPVLLLDSYVDAEIVGREIQGAVELSREALRSGDQVWLVSEKNTLKIQEVTIEARAPENVYVTKGLQTGDQVVTSDLPTPVEGMKLERAGSPDGSGGSNE